MTSNAGAGPQAVARPGKTSSAKFAEADAKYASKMDSMTMQERMLLGLPYLSNGKDQQDARMKSRNLIRAYNSTSSGPMSPDEEGANDMTNARRRELIGEIFQISPEQAKRIFIEPPFYCDYGPNIKFEGDFYCNFNTCILDCAEIRMGHGVLFGPNVAIYAATHSVSVAEREDGWERALPVAIGRNTWIGGNVVIMAGVRIGEGCTIGAGSVVTRDIPDWSVAVGNPARIVKVLDESERGRRDGQSTMVPF